MSFFLGSHLALLRLMWFHYAGSCPCCLYSLDQKYVMFVHFCLGINFPLWWLSCVRDFLQQFKILLFGRVFINFTMVCSGPYLCLFPSMCLVYADLGLLVGTYLLWSLNQVLRSPSACLMYARLQVWQFSVSAFV
jgi:hypothetical protein